MGGPGRSRQRRWPGVRPPPAVSKSHIPGLCAPRPCLAQPIGRRPPFRPSGPAAPRAAGNHSRTFTWRGICGVPGCRSIGPVSRALAVAVMGQAVTGRAGRRAITRPPWQPGRCPPGATPGPVRWRRAAKPTAVMGPSLPSRKNAVRARRPSARGVPQGLPEQRASPLSGRALAGFLLGGLPCGSPGQAVQPTPRRSGGHHLDRRAAPRAMSVRE